ncbi:MAG: mitochondrial fission ELM1 family protein, partial [Alphaproteobacteria bacterium]
RQRGGVPSVAVHIQDPKLPLDRFDLVVAPAHDRLRGANVLTTQTAVHHLTRDRLDQAAGQAPAAVLALPRPLVAVLLGGPNRYYRFDHKAADGLAAQLAALAESGAGLVITPSRRTPADAVRRLRRQLPAHGVHLWDGTPPNPYAAILGQADAVMVTCDSVSMISEATASGRPVWLLDLPRRRSDHRFRAFHQAIIASGMVHRWQGRLETWTYAPPDETGRVADAVADRLRQRSQPAAIAQATGDG